MKAKKVKKKKLLPFIAEDALKKAVYEAIKDHARTGDKVAIYRDGKVIMVPATQLLKKKKRK